MNHHAWLFFLLMSAGAFATTSSNDTCHVPLLSAGVMPGMCSQSKQLPPKLAIRGNEIIDASSKQILLLRGINWFGFNNGQTSVDGLWAGGASQATDFNTIVYKLKLLGFNAVRLPFTFSDISKRPLDKRMKCKVSTLQDILYLTSTPGDVPPKTKLPPCFIGVLPHSHMCNEYLDTTSTLNRLAQTMETFVKNGMYVVLDYHPMGSESHARNVKTFTEAWASLWQQLLKLKPMLQGRVILDILNEPDSMSIGWTRNKTAGGYPSYSDLALAMMDKVSSFDKQMLFMIEGTGQVSFKLNWGDGFVTDQRIIKQYGIDDATDFFRKLSGKSYRTNVIIGVHMYGPTISKNKEVHKGQKLRDRIDASFGYLFSPGFQNKFTYPIVVGEFGSFFQDKEDIAHLNDFAAYLRTRFQGKVGWLYWAYNANSGDTGGIVTDDWQGLIWTKLKWLQKNLGLKPWYIV